MTSTPPEHTVPVDDADTAETTPPVSAVSLQVNRG